MSLALRLYRRLARAYPHEFQLAFGSEVDALGEDVVRRMGSRLGTLATLRLLTDMALRMPIEYLSEIGRDMRHGFRALLKSRGFARVGILSMGIGIGLTTVVYNSNWQLVSRPLPGAANAARLAMPEKPVSYPDVVAYRAETSLFDGVTAFETGIPFNVAFPTDPGAKGERIFGQIVSPEYFAVLGVKAERGRVLDPVLDRTGDAPGVVVSDRFWRNRLDASPRAVGETLLLNGRPATIVGVAPPGFNGALAMNPAELFVPTTVPASLAPELGGEVLRDHNAREFVAILLLRKNVTLESAEAALDTVASRLDAEDPSHPRGLGKAHRVSLLPAGAIVPLPRRVKVAIVLFYLALMGLIMTIACMNLANMLLARGIERRKELAIRVAIGASRFRLVRQMMSEGISLSLLGGLAGFALAYMIAILAAHFILPTAVPVEPRALPDGGAALFVFAVAVLSGSFFSVAPALRATATDLTPALKEGATPLVPGYRLFGLRNVLMVGQIGGSLMLLLITGFLVIGISHVSSVRTRFDTRGMVLLSLDPLRDGYTEEATRALFKRLPRELAQDPSVRRVALAGQAPFAVENEDSDGAVPVSAGEGGSRVEASALEEVVGAGYFASLSEPLIAGREFHEEDERVPDDGSKSLPVLLNESAAEALFAKGDAVGARLRDERAAYEVVGVVHDFKAGLGLSPPIVYLPMTDRVFARPPAGGITVMVRSEAGREALASARRTIGLTDPGLSIFNARTLHDYIELRQSHDRFAVDTFGGIGLFGLILAAIGLGGVTAYAVAQRRKEIGIRMALGARRGQVLLLVLREGACLVAVGTTLGFLGAAAIVRLLASLTSVFVDSLKVGTNDPRLLFGAPLLLAAIAMLACYLPARKAVAIDPLRALREL